MGIISAIVQAFRYPQAPVADTFRIERETNELTGGYEKSIDRIRKKYFDIDKKGSLITRTIVDYRSSAIAGGEISFSADDRTLPNLEAWMDQVKASERSTSYAQLLEREGRVAIVLYLTPNGWSFRALPWHQYKYDLVYDDYDNIVGIKYETDEGEYTVTKPYLVYVQYSGQNEYSKEVVAPPKIAYCLSDIEEIDAELERWANINHFFADPTPHIDTSDLNFFSKLVALLTGRKEDSVPQGGTEDEETRKERSARRWKIGQGLTTANTTLQYVQAEMRGVESLDRIIQVRCERISALTGYPIYLLYPELMSNRATAEEIAADTNQATVIERRKNEELWAEIAKAWATLENQFSGTSYDIDSIYAVLPQVSASQISLLTKTYFPLVQNKVISMRTFREMFPLVDPTVELERLEEEASLQVSEISNAMLNFTGDKDNNQPIDTPNDIEAEAKAKLKGTVGGVEGILSIQESVANGLTDYNSAIALLFEIYGFDEKTSKRILGNPKLRRGVQPA